MNRDSRSPDRETLTAGLMAIWEGKLSAVLTRVGTIESAAAYARCQSLTRATRRIAEYDAQKLAGLLGTFGFNDASTLALEAERLLRGEETLSRESAFRLVTIAAQLKNQLAVDKAA